MSWNRFIDISWDKKLECDRFVANSQVGLMPLCQPQMRTIAPWSRTHYHLQQASGDTRSFHLVA
ncbi:MULTISPECIES: hypothetical protein [unclassified Microcoleus]|uniref:hypothetical protein n=1 Tax=unclassified Microcoleus TaxID=2642155 RepID=UPI001DBB7DA1|nr:MULTISPECIES: hypothetical protein [unclassified Microcoleus]MCC3433994.1 hypothetical protein [Microcoleus sp. PH2017_05_CCC_O_A]MCC3583537.1 hypothetical protein [Microcoleus sp. PH2017_30_WIL_O_A]